MRPVLFLALVLVLGCSDPGPKPETPAERRTRCEKEIAASGDRDWRPYFELGALDESEGDLDKAVDHYGAAVALLPPRRITRPALSLGRVHLKRNNLEAARRLFEEVLGTVPEDAALYRQNPDYREAALGLKEVFAHSPDPKAEERVRERFLDELGGSEREWPKP